MLQSRCPHSLNASSQWSLAQLSSMRMWLAAAGCCLSNRDVQYFYHPWVHIARGKHHPCCMSAENLAFTRNTDVPEYFMRILCCVCVIPRVLILFKPQSVSKKEIKQIYWIIRCVTFSCALNKTDLLNYRMSHPSVGLSIKQIYWIIRCVTFSCALNKTDLLNYQMCHPSVVLSIKQIYWIIRCVSLQLGSQ